ncbi:MAG: hypothetical protein WA417_08960 [Stellaceae bacterium]
MTMAANVRCRFATAELPTRPVEARISAFLDGKTNGEELLHALFDHVLHEPIPQSMRAILKQQA